MRQAGLPLTRKQALPTTTLLHGDCLEVMPTLPANSIQMVFADLPYGLLRWKHWDKIINLSKFWASVAQALSHHWVATFTANIRFACSLISSRPDEFRYDLVWSKLRPSNFMLGKKRPLNYHENILVFGSKSHVYNPQMIEASQRLYTEERSRTQNNAYANPFYEQRFAKMLRASQGPMYPKTLLTGLNRTRDDGRLHPTQKPIALLEWLVKTYTNPGDTVLDPVFGSCTTGVACLRTGRNFIGIEKDKTYYDIGCKRVADERTRLEAL